MTSSSHGDSTLGALLSLATHDLRNPLSVLLTNLGYLESVLATGDLVECRAVLADLGIACDSLSRYLSNLDVLGGDLSSRPLTRSRTPVLGLVQSSVERVRLALDQQSLQVAWEVPPDCPDLYVDSELAARGLENLLANAATFAPRGTVVRLEASVLAGAELVRLSLLDEGSPLPHEHRELAFRADGQELLHREAASRYGRGLGLLIAGIVADRLGGAVSAPPVTRGSRFDLDFPVAPPDSALERFAVPTFRPEQLPDAPKGTGED
jgi:two-component system, OmpR family, sensor histidine kinase KdpD